MILTRCPSCKKGVLFKGFITFADACDQCGFSYQGREIGDGPAYIAIVLVGTIAGVGAAVMEVALAPSFWLHALVWVPFIILGSLWTLRMAKAVMLSAQFQLRRDDFKTD